jgi:SAM-dependent methyltransferase
MDYEKVYTEDYFSGRDSFFYMFGYGRFQKFYLKSLSRPLQPYIKKFGQGKVLDIGCAYGSMLQKFPDRFEKFGIDISEYAIAEGRKKFPHSIFKVSGAEDALPFPENSFDIIICNDVIEHLENPDAALQNIQKVLKKDGVLYINTPNFNWIRKKLFSYADKKEHHISLFPHKTLFDLLIKCNFRIIDHWTYTNITLFFFSKFNSNIGPESAFICKKL